MRRTLRLAAAVPALALMGALLHGCGDADADDVTAPPTASGTTLVDCAELIPDDVVGELGWTNASAPTLDSATCTRTAGQGRIEVERRPVPGTSSDDLPAAGQKQYDDRCAALSDGRAGEEVDWLGADVSGCAVVTADGSGVNVLLALTEAGLLVETRVYVDQPVASAEQVRAALTDLAQGAVARLG